MDNFFTADLIGYENIQDILNKNIEEGKLHHAVLFSGFEGSGKRKLCLEVAKNILKQNSNRMDVDIESHPDVKIISPNLEESKKGDITIKQIRALNGFLQLKSGFSDCKIIILDAVDNLNKNAANSLLKILEEPPENSFFLCLSHNPNKLLETIKSRVLNIKLPTLTLVQTKEILLGMDLGFKQSDIDIALEFFPHQAGKVIEMIESKVLSYKVDVEKIVNSKSILEREKLIQKFNLKDNHLFNILNELISHEIYKIVKSGSVQKNQDEILALWLSIPQKLGECLNLNLDRANYLRSLLNNFNNLYVR